MLAIVIFVVAFLYSTVGHGGASGYLAAMAFSSVDHRQMATTALVLNILVAGIALISYARAGHVSLQLSWPFLITSIPMAFLGGLVQISPRSYYLALAAILVFAAIRLVTVVPIADQGQAIAPDLRIALPAGAVLGFVSGLVGIGGGIFLSPLLLFMRWADAKKTAGTAALFIVLNSAAGLTARFSQANIAFVELIPYAVSAFAGGILGSWAGAYKFSRTVLCRLLALVLLVAALKLVFTYI